MARYAIQGVTTPVVDEVQVKRHPLEREASRLNSLARRVGLRLTIMMRRIEDKEVVLEKVTGRDPETGQEHTTPVLDQHGNKIMVPLMPDKDFRENWKLYQQTVMQLLQEQRARAALAPESKQPIDDATFERQLKELAKQALNEMSDGELSELLARRAISVTSGVSSDGTTAVVVDRSAVTNTEDRAGSTPVAAQPSDNVLAGFDDET